MVSSTLDRRKVLALLFPKPDEYLMISGLAGPARDASALTQDGTNLFTMAGTMGAAISMGLGVAMSAPDKKVAVIAGDGEMLMNIGSLATVASVAPANLSIVCIDNGCHGETGGQAGHTSNKTDLEMMAKGAGIGSTMSIDSESDLARGEAFLNNAPGPHFVVVKVMAGAPAAFNRNLNLAECRLRFKQAYLEQNDKK